MDLYPKHLFFANQIVNHSRNKTRIVYIVPKTSFVETTFGRLVNNIQTCVTRLLFNLFRINKPPKGKLTIIRFSRYPQPPHITMGAVQ
uniref:Uncharacterized protein n=1 Tax=Helianthus annuus TaxID=4232 RepID=A0A251TI96_HELAN